MKTKNFNTEENEFFEDKGSQSQFTGDVYIKGLVSSIEVNGLYSVSLVKFMPDSRTHWHTHPAGQILLVIEGTGWYKEKGKKAKYLQPGDVIVVPENVQHWHGSGKNTSLKHYEISNNLNGTVAIWLDKVSYHE